MYALYILSHILVAAIVPLFMAALLPITTLSTLALDKNWQHLSSGLKHPVFLSTFVISIALIISCIFSTTPLHSLEAALKTAILLLCFGYLWGAKINTKNWLTDAQKTGLHLTFAISIAVILCLNIFTYFEVLSWQPSTLNRQLVLFALFFWPLRLYFNTVKQHKQFLATAALLILTFLLGYSETATLMFLVGILTYYFFKYFPSSNRTHTALLTIGLISITFMPFLLSLIEPEIVHDRVSNLPLSKQHHYSIWLECTNHILSALPTGTGINSTQLLDLETSFSGHVLPLHHPHNLAIELLLECGVLGALLLALGLTAAARLFYTTPKAFQPTLAALLVTICLLYSVAFSFWQEWRTAAIAGALILFHRFLTEHQQHKS